MGGADEYYDLFNGKSQQIGRFFLKMHKHARGKCFEMFLLPENFDLEKGSLLSDCVEIYGVTGGQKGWTESYGWLHKGKWQEDFFKLVKQRKKERKIRIETKEKQDKIDEQAANEKTNKLLSSY